MNPYWHGRGRWFGNGGGPGRWLLPLVIGVGLGALLFGGPRIGYRNVFDGYRYDPGVYPPGYTPPTAPAVPPLSEPALEPRYEGSREYRHGPGFGPFTPGWHHGGFGFGRLLVPLLLIGGGVWLLRNRRQAPSSGGEPPQSPPPAAPNQGQSPTPPTPPAEPTTGETRRL